MWKTWVPFPLPRESHTHIFHLLGDHPTHQAISYSGGGGGEHSLPLFLKWFYLGDEYSRVRSPERDHTKVSLTLWPTVQHTYWEGSPVTTLKTVYFAQRVFNVVQQQPLWKETHPCPFKCPLDQK